MFYFTLFLLFLYFKIARVHKKEEKFTTLYYAQHIAVAIAAIALYMYGLSHFSLVAVLGSSVVFFILAALMVTAVQLGIFVDGKPLVSISKIYKMMPFLAFFIIIFSLRFWSL